MRREEIVNGVGLNEKKSSKQACGWAKVTKPIFTYFYF
jgi:hypothetical protein